MVAVQNEPLQLQHVPLNQETLAHLPDTVSVPEYDRSALKRGVLHIGVGGFHRAHQAVYLDDLARAGLGDDWGLTGVGLHRPQMGEVMQAQDCLWVVVERGTPTTARVVGVMTRYLHGASEPDAVLDALADPDTRLVTLTITGDGYNLTPEGEFSVDDPTVAQDLDDVGNPHTVFGYLVEGLARRRDAGTRPFTVLSCDNIPRNGEAARTMVVSFARLRDPELAEWIGANVAFPSSMVDRITPETTPEDRDEIAGALGVDDRWPVITEPFSQWVVEDTFCNGRPALDQVGVQFVDDVVPYELIKKRLLNASHCAIGYLGYLAGYRTTAEVMADPVFVAFVEGMADEIIPLLPKVEGLDLQEYKKSLLERLANPQMADQLQRLCRRGSTKMPSYLLPSIKDAVAAGRPHTLLSLATAGWFRFLRGEDYAGEPVSLEGTRRDELQPRAAAMGTDPTPLLELRDLFDGLSDAPTFVEDVEVALISLEQGPREAIQALLAVKATV